MQRPVSDGGLDRRLTMAEAGMVTHGLQGARVLAPDELIMQAEEPEEMTEDKGRQEAFAALFGELFRVQRTAEDLGWAVWAMVCLYARPLLPRTETRRMEQVAMRRMEKAAVLPLGPVDAAVVAGMLGFLLRPVSGYEQTSKLGKRTMVFAYIFCRSEAVRRTVPSLEVMGRLWGLSAANKRSAPNAAVQRMKEEMEGYFLRTGHRAEDIIMPGQKSEESRAKYAAAQRGNDHRVRGMQRRQSDSETVRQNQ